MKPRQTRPAKLWKAELAVIFLTAGLLFLFLQNPKNGRKVAGRPSSSASQNAASVPSISGVDKLVERLDNLQRYLSSSHSAADAAAALSAMARALANSTPTDAARALSLMLDKGVDALTGLEFRVGPGGVLASAPTFRVWMLDQLGQIDTAAAASFSAEIYARHDSADEWALALRNDWRIASTSGAIEPVRARALELIDDQVWSLQPSRGYLEAVDVTVATLAWEAVPRFEQWLGPTQPTSLRTAAWIALDRMTMEMPSDFLPALAQNRAWLMTQPQLRAGLMARANLDSASELKAVETYLARTDISETEGARFFELLPNVSATVSFNLVTIARTPGPAQAAQLDRAALHGVRQFQQDERFTRWKDNLVAAETRLVDSVNSATRGGYLKP